MISKYAGTCRYCNKPTLANKDQYDLDSKTSFHAKCEKDAESAPPGPDAYALADKLGYRQISWEEILRVLHVD